MQCLNVSTMKKTLLEVAKIKFGLHAQPSEYGEIRYIQARQFDNAGKLNDNDYYFINLDEKSRHHLLRDGDVLFAGKGFRNFAWCYRRNLGSAIASSIFFVITPNQDLIYPEFLAAIFNLPQSQTYFQQIGGGTNIVSIRKSELGTFSLPLPSLEKQKMIVEITNLHQSDLQLMHELIKLKEEHYKALISKIIE